MADFREVPANAIPDNAIKLIGDDWMLITAGTLDSYNTMTASWGALGVLWSKPVAFCFVRPQRHTYGFIERHDTFSLSFFRERHRDALTLCGTKSGREVDKAKETGLVALAGNDATVHFEQARLVFECRKLYFQDIEPDRFLDPAIDENYPTKDYHRMYVGEITRCLLR